MERRRFLRALGAGSAGLVLAAPSVTAAQQRQGIDEPGRELLADASGIDRTHLPMLALPARPRLGRSFDLVVRIGDPLHEQRRDHHVEWIEVRYAGEALFACDLSASVPFPVVRIPVVLRQAAELVVRLRCSQHGVHRFSRPLAPA